MKAVVLAAGKGERLMPLTETRPKHLIPIGGVPLLEWSLRGLASLGIREVLLVTHYMEKQIMDRFSDGSGLGLEISYIRQRELGGTADAFRMAEAFVDGEEFLGLYGDLFVSSECFNTLIRAHRKREITLCAVPVEDPSQTGVLTLNDDIVTDIVEKPPPGKEPSNLGNAGIYVFTPEILTFIRKTGLSSRGEYEVTDSIKAMIDSGSSVRAVTLPKEDWLDVGLPWNLLDANAGALSLLEPSVGGKVEEGAQIIGPVKVDEGARIRSGA